MKAIPYFYDQNPTLANVTPKSIKPALEYKPQSWWKPLRPLLGILIRNHYVSIW